MVRLKGPLFSMEASGTIANSLVFAKWKGRDYARRHAIPANPRSGLQVGIRTVFGFCSQYFASLTSGELSKWVDAAVADNISAINAFTRDAVERARRNLGWRADADGDATDTPGPPTALGGTPQPKTVVLDWTNDIVGDTPDFCTAIYRNEGTIGHTDDISTLIGIVPVSQETFTDRGLTTGQPYSYLIKHINKDGGVSTRTALDDITPL